MAMGKQAERRRVYKCLVPLISWYWKCVPMTTDVAGEINVASVVDREARSWGPIKIKRKTIHLATDLTSLRINKAIDPQFVYFSRIYLSWLSNILSTDASWRKEHAATRWNIVVLFTAVNHVPRYRKKPFRCFLWSIASTQPRGQSVRQ